mgnify:CR=1 FL=1
MLFLPRAGCRLPRRLFNAAAPTAIHPLALLDPLPISASVSVTGRPWAGHDTGPNASSPSTTFVVQPTASAARASSPFA